MKKIGILTFHRSYNYGAFMQCYSLSKRIESEYADCKVDVIDYCTERMYENYPTSFIPLVFGPRYNRNSLSRIIKQAGRCILDPCLIKRRKKLYQGFHDDINALNFSQFHIVSDKTDDLFKLIDEQYDILVIGSDAVWEYKTYPFPNAYFPNYEFKKTKLLSYAASSDRMYSSDLTEFDRNYIKDTLDKFIFIGIRDKATENFLASISQNLMVCHTCDPTVFLDIEKIPRNLDRVKRELSLNDIDLSQPIIGIMGDEDTCRMLRKMFGRQYKIVSIYQHLYGADYNFDYLTPFEWARIFSLFSVTVTKYFHGSLLSLKNGTPTVATDYWYMVSEDHITKIADLYHRLELDDHYFYMPDIGQDKSIIKERIEYFIHNPDKDRIKEALLKESLSYNNFDNALRKVLA